MMWIACPEGSEGEGCEYMVIAKCQECGRVVQTPRGRDAAPSDHCWENWPLSCNDEEGHGGIYCSEECLDPLERELYAHMGFFKNKS